MLSLSIHARITVQLLLVLSGRRKRYFYSCVVIDMHNTTDHKGPMEREGVARDTDLYPRWLREISREFGRSITKSVTAVNKF